MRSEYFPPECFGGKYKPLKKLHFHISRHIVHLGWETPMFFTASFLGQTTSYKTEVQEKKRGDSREKGEEETKSMPHAPVNGYCESNILVSKKDHVSVGIKVKKF
jgi:hypothetical protein